jgi:GntR family transcriptional regulator
LGELLVVSRTVVREALRVLEDEGLIARRHGVGTFVRNAPILKNLNFNFGITEMIKSAGLKPGTGHMVIRPEVATVETAAQLKVPEGADLLSIERVRTADGKPVVYSLDTFPAALVRGNNFDANRLLEESLYRILQVEFGLVIEYGIAQILPAAATAELAELLSIPQGSVLLSIEQTDFGEGEKPLVYSREFHLPDSFDFMVWRRGPAKLRGPTAP